MALSRRFGKIRKRSEDADEGGAMDEAFLRKKIFLMSQIAPRHSWGGTASTQTKIDVKDEILETIKGNLAFRFKAAKAIYARAEDPAVEPYQRDDCRSRVQLNKTAVFNVKQLLNYNMKPHPLNEMGVKIYYKYNSFIRRKLQAYSNRLPSAKSANPITSVNSGGSFSGIGQKRGFAEIADETSLMSAAKRVAAKSCLPQMHKISEGPSTHLNQATHARNTGAVQHGPISPRSSSSTESAASSQMCEDTEAVPESHSRRDGGATGGAAPFSRPSYSDVASAHPRGDGDWQRESLSTSAVSAPHADAASRQADSGRISEKLRDPSVAQNSTQTSATTSLALLADSAMAQAADTTISADTSIIASDSAAASAKKTKKSSRPKVIPQTPVDGYAKEDPRPYDPERGKLLHLDLQFLNVRKLVSNWVKYEMKVAKSNKKKSSSTSSSTADDADMGIYLDNWRSLLLSSSRTANKCDSNAGRGVDVKPERGLAENQNGSTRARRSVDPRPAAKKVEQRRLGGRSEYPQTKKFRSGADTDDDRHANSFCASTRSGEEVLDKLSKTLS